MSAADWDAALEAYGDSAGFTSVLPVTCVQGLLSLDDLMEGSSAAASWTRSLAEAASRLS